MIPETLVVPCDATGNENVDDAAVCLQIGGWLSHQKALEFLGFTVVGGTEEVDPDAILNMAHEAWNNSTDFAESGLPLELLALLGSDAILNDIDDAARGTGTED